MVHAVSTSSWEVEAGRSLQFQASLVCIMSQGYNSETLDKKQNQNKETKRSWHRGYVSGLRHTVSAQQTQGVKQAQSNNSSRCGYHPGLQMANA